MFVNNDAKQWWYFMVSAIALIVSAIWSFLLRMVWDLGYWRADKLWLRYWRSTLVVFYVIEFCLWLLTMLPMTIINCLCEAAAIMNVNNICEAVTCHQSVRSKSITSFERLILINLNCIGEDAEDLARCFISARNRLWRGTSLESSVGGDDGGVCFWRLHMWVMDKFPVAGEAFASVALCCLSLRIWRNPIIVLRVAYSVAFEGAFRWLPTEFSGTNFNSYKVEAIASLTWIYILIMFSLKCITTFEANLTAREHGGSVLISGFVVMRNLNCFGEVVGSSPLYYVSPRSEPNLGKSYEACLKRESDG